jgi:hypothetical protein
MYNYQYLRCPKCGVTHEGVHVGNVIYTFKVSIYHKHKPNTEIAVVSRCGSCSYIHNISLIPGAVDGNNHPTKSEAEKLGVTVYDVRSCYTKMPCDFYSLAELKAGRVKGVQDKVVDVDYNPDQFTEPEKKYNVAEEDTKLF